MCDLLPRASVRGLACFENLKEFDYLGRKVFRKVLKGFSTSASLFRLERLETLKNLNQNHFFKNARGPRVSFVLCHEWIVHLLHHARTTHVDLSVPQWLGHWNNFFSFYLFISLKVLVRQQGKSLKILFSLTFSSFFSFYVLFRK